MHTSHTYHCHEHDAHKEHTHGRIIFLGIAHSK